MDFIQKEVCGLDAHSVRQSIRSIGRGDSPSLSLTKRSACSPIIGLERGCWQSLEIIQVGTVWVHAESIANRDRLFHVRMRTDHGVSIDSCHGPVPLSISPRNGKTLQRSGRVNDSGSAASFTANHQTRAEVVKADADGLTLQLKFSEQRATRFQLLTIFIGQGPTSQSFANVKLVFRVDIFGVPNIHR